MPRAPRRQPGRGRVSRAKKTTEALDALVTAKPKPKRAARPAAAAKPAAKAEAKVYGQCPVTGKDLSKGRVFAGLGSDAKAKSVINGLLHPEGSVRRDVAEKQMQRWYAPEAAAHAAQLAEKEGYDGKTAPVTSPSELVHRAQVELGNLKEG